MPFAGRLIRRSPVLPLLTSPNVVRHHRSGDGDDSVQQRRDREAFVGRRKLQTSEEARAIDHARDEMRLGEENLNKAEDEGG